MSAGLALSTWATLIPFAKARLQLNDGQLGSLLLCLGLGSIVTMPFAGSLAGRFGCRRVIVVAALVICGLLPPLAMLHDPIGVCIVLQGFGGALGTLDVTMNVQAVLVERDSSRAIMSSFHRLFSVGGLIGAGGLGLLLSVGLTPATATLVAVTTIFSLIGLSFPALLTFGSDEAPPAFVLPRGYVLLLDVMCFVLFIGEGAVTDWSGVRLQPGRDPRAAPADQTGPARCRRGRSARVGGRLEPADRGSRGALTRDRDAPPD